MTEYLDPREGFTGMLSPEELEEILGAEDERQR